MIKLNETNNEILEKGVSILIHTFYVKIVEFQPVYHWKFKQSPYLAIA